MYNASHFSLSALQPWQWRKWERSKEIDEKVRKEGYVRKCYAYNRAIAYSAMPTYGIT